MNSSRPSFGSAAAAPGRAFLAFAGVFSLCGGPACTGFLQETVTHTTSDGVQWIRREPFESVEVCRPNARLSDEGLNLSARWETSCRIRVTETRVVTDTTFHNRPSDFVQALGFGGQTGLRVGLAAGAVLVLLAPLLAVSAGQMDRQPSEIGVLGGTCVVGITGGALALTAAAALRDTKAGHEIEVIEREGPPRKYQHVEPTNCAVPSTKPAAGVLLTITQDGIPLAQSVTDESGQSLLADLVPDTGAPRNAETARIVCEGHPPIPLRLRLKRVSEEAPPAAPAPSE